MLASPFLLFTLGVLVRGHVQPMLRRGAAVGRATGLFTVLVLAPMVLSGYGLQVAVSPAWRNGLAWVHGIASLLFLAGYAVHLGRTWEQARLDREREQTMEELAEHFQQWAQNPKVREWVCGQCVNAEERQQRLREIFAVATGGIPSGDAAANGKSN